MMRYRTRLHERPAKIVFIRPSRTVPLWLTPILIPVVLVFWAALGLAAIALPIVGAVKAFEGAYFRDPVIGVAPAADRGGATGA